jgi:hypothetical protein
VKNYYGTEQEAMALNGLEEPFKKKKLAIGRKLSTSYTYLSQSTTK